MATITEDYVSPKVAKLLRDRGFPQDPYICNTVYTPKGKLSNNAKSFWNPFAFTLLGREYYMAPTLQMAMKWLREIHNTNIDIVSVWNQKRFEYQVFVVTPENAKHCYVDDKLYLGYEEACETAIKYCLENLI